MAAMCLIENSLDDLLHEAIDAVLKHGERVCASKGPNLELRAVTLQLTNPLARLSRSESRGRVFSSLAELLWYLSGSNATDHIAHYIPKYREYDEEGVVFGGYGPRLRGDADHLLALIQLLRDRSSTRRAVIPIFDRRDLLEKHEDVPCTCTLQFLNRDSGLDLVVYMRSNDVFIGLPHDVFCFSMLQELVARAISAEVGQYIHVAGSLHLYDVNAEHAQRFRGEGYFEAREMPPMPGNDPLAAVAQLVAVEEQLRAGSDPLSVVLPSDEYWGDLARLLVIFELGQVGRDAEIQSVISQMSTDVFHVHVADRLDRMKGNQ